MLFTTTTYQHRNTTWHYLDIPPKAIKERFNWVNLKFLNIKKTRHGAHEYDIRKLFIVTTSFTNKEQVIEWVTINSPSKLNSTHFQLIDEFCYTENKTTETLDELIEKTHDRSLLHFILHVIDRSLLWHNPEPTWPSELERMIAKSSDFLETEFELPTGKLAIPEIEGVDHLSNYPHTYSYYKFQNLINGIKEGKLYYDINVLSKQAHESLLATMSIYFNSFDSPLDERDWQKKMVEWQDKETNWCKELLIQHQ